MKFEEFKTTLKRRFDEKPEQVLMAAALTLNAVGNIINLTSSSASKRAYARAQNHRIKNN